jgi:vacuolar-type H+-ATPase subunit F/Vma7
MARLVVLTSPALADGFRLAGCATVVAAPGVRASAALRDAIAEDDVGLLLVTADVWATVDDLLRASVEQLARPVVTPVPVGAVADGMTRGKLIGEMLQRAIGYRIELAVGDGR